MEDKESITADIVVVGYGLAGATAAIVARDAGAEVVILEKSARFDENAEILRDVDYLYVDFPDYCGDPVDEPGFLNRVIASSIYFESIVRRAIAVGEGLSE